MIQFPGFMTPPSIVFIYYVPGGDSSSDWLNFSFTNLSEKAANCSIKIKEIYNKITVMIVPTRDLRAKRRT